MTARARTAEPSANRVAKWRRHTFGCDGGVADGVRVVPLNSAGAALMPACVYGAVTSHLARENAIGGYEAAEERSTALRRVYAGVAFMIER